MFVILLNQHEVGSFVLGVYSTRDLAEISLASYLVNIGIKDTDFLSIEEFKVDEGPRKTY